MKKILIATILASSLISTSSFATGAYLGIQGGESWMSLKNNESGKDTQDNNSFSSDVHFGYLFPINDSFSIGPEIGIGKDFFEPEIAEVLFGITHVQTDYYMPVLLRSQYQISDDFYVFGKLGVTYVSQFVIESINFSDKNYNVKKWQGSFGAGLGYNFTNSFAIELSYNYVGGSDTPPVFNKDKYDDTAKFQNISIGLNYSF